MLGNYFVCSNEVFIEGFSVGTFASFESDDDRNTVTANATIMLPIYSVGVKGPNGSVIVKGGGITTQGEERFKGVPFKVGAKVEVYAWYEDIKPLEQQFEKLLVFKGYIKQIIGGFPTKLVCEDMSFPLRFGITDKKWQNRTTIKSMLNYLIPIANQKFQEYRTKEGLTGSWENITADIAKDLVDAEFTLDIWKNCSPLETITEIMSRFNMYCKVRNDGTMWIGVGMGQAENPTVNLNTQYNVIGRDLVPKSGLFVNYYVEVNAVDKSGQKISAKVGYDGGEPTRLPFSSLNTTADIEKLARSVLSRLQTDVNSGTITTLLYPAIEMFDYISYTDTILPEYSSNYRVIKHSRMLGGSGYRQVLTVTDQSLVY